MENLILKSLKRKKLTRYVDKFMIILLVHHKALLFLITVKRRINGSANWVLTGAGMSKQADFT